MKIIILGAGQVGGTLAETLSYEENDITVVDTNSARLRELQDTIDIRTICGKASFPHILQQAGSEDADMLIAVTSSDEVNMMACQVAYSLFSTPTKIARIRQSDYYKHDKLFSNDACPVDVIISPEQVVTQYIQRLIEQPGALQVTDFAEGKLQLVAVKAYYGGPLVGHELRYIKQHMPNIKTRVAAIFRRGKSIHPEGNTVIEVGDEVFFIAAKEHIREVMGELRRLDHNHHRIMIAGGGNIGMRLAQAIEGKYQVKIIEQNRKRCHYLSQNLTKTTVFEGSASDKTLLFSEDIENVDIFCAVTNDDEANVMSAMLAKRLGARKVMALINNPAYVDLVQGGDIDIAISPQLATTSTLLRHVRRADVVMVHRLNRGSAEAIEAVAHGEAGSSKVVGKRIQDIALPPQTSIGAVLRGEEVLIAYGELEIASGDHVIIFVTDKRHIPDVEKLFQVGIRFF